MKLLCTAFTFCIAVKINFCRPIFSTWCDSQVLGLWLVSKAVTILPGSLLPPNKGSGCPAPSLLLLCRSPGKRCEFQAGDRVVEWLHSPSLEREC